MRHVFATNETVEVITLEICEGCEFASFQNSDHVIQCSAYHICIRAMEETQKPIDKD